MEEKTKDKSILCLKRFKYCIKTSSHMRFVQLNCVCLCVHVCACQQASRSVCLSVSMVWLAEVAGLEMKILFMFMDYFCCPCFAVGCYAG